ncbi:DUF4145 domain-containing protein [Fusibacter ferrireducens]|uniref:DUF4145 domain-containing protein n=1 Tax=Fusibacter ferrireducens TaxID=2785058 RepID=A0ABS0A1N1_9FIRM|nr:DUF4145 domain-containing protein [Fusibacter ferrireducens]MBF4696060.1 DUF4145 domain-containing protein [Fusibacter ferrireducens]
MNPRLQRMINRLKEIIDQSIHVLSTSKTEDYHEWISDKELLNEWLIKSQNIIALIFGQQSIQYNRLISLLDTNIYNSEDVKIFSGFLKGCLSDLENGFIIGQEFIIASEIFDNVLEESKHLLETSHKDASAVLARVVIEDALKRIARNSNIATDQKASKLNEELKKLEIYSQPQWRLIQAWLDIGNSAAHGNFENYTKDDVNNMINGIEQFIASDSFK